VEDSVSSIVRGEDDREEVDVGGAEIRDSWSGEKERSESGIFVGYSGGR